MKELDAWQNQFCYFDLLMAKLVGFLTGMLTSVAGFGLYEVYIWLMTK